MACVKLVFPHQLFRDNPLKDIKGTWLLVEEYLFFNQYKFHKQKLSFHRATMRFYADYLQENGWKVEYISAQDERHDIRVWFEQLSDHIQEIHFIDPVDDWLEKRIKNGAAQRSIKVKKRESPQFLNSDDEIRRYFRPEKKKFHQTTFYKQQRIERNILLDGSDPKGGQWTYDKENRKKYPSRKIPPTIDYPPSSPFFEEAKVYVLKYYPDNPGSVQNPLYPINFQQADHWLEDFLAHRFEAFGPYEDAIVDNQPILHHSVLSPLINAGLLTPQFVLQRILEFSTRHNIPINSVEGLVRQIIGWREFIRGIYSAKGIQERTTNFWKFKRAMPDSFYNGSTGILPFDHTIQKVLETGYCHHIERLMILANFMTLCEIHPDHIYQWFMELFIDAYDWVMVPNVYGMATFADGGLMSTKPYISGSNYILKMSNYRGGEWASVWDGLFWRFMHEHRGFFEANPRLSMLVRNLDRMGGDKLQKHLETASIFLKDL